MGVTSHLGTSPTPTVTCKSRFGDNTCSWREITAENPRSFVVVESFQGMVKLEWWFVMRILYQIPHSKGFPVIPRDVLWCFFVIPITFGISSKLTRNESTSSTSHCAKIIPLLFMDFWDPRVSPGTSVAIRCQAQLRKPALLIEPIRHLPKLEHRFPQKKLTYYRHFWNQRGP